MDVLFRGYDSYNDSHNYVHKPADKWVVNKDNFLKLKVGMTLKEFHAWFKETPGGAVSGNPGERLSDRAANQEMARA